ncbi:MAG: type III pantothenate kinase [Chitinophagales bacterium]|jgi:type III pantothenate kinase
MNCLIDQGNTKTKIYFIEEEKIVQSYAFFNDEEQNIQLVLQSSEFKQGIYSSSSSIPDFIKEEQFLILTKDTPIPINLNYHTPGTLGTDRIALAVGANYLYPNRSSLILSAGTCITIDLIDKEGVFQGGIITLGLDMRRKALHNQTANLPLIEQQKPTHIPLVGKTTLESMQSGVFNGALNEISATIERFKAIYHDLTVIITGGDAYLFEFHLKNEIFAQQNLQAIGLNRILLYNAD